MEWIDVKDGLPQRNQFIIGATKDGTVKYQFYGKHGFIYDYIYWMSIPECPVGK